MAEPSSRPADQWRWIMSLLEAGEPSRPDVNTSLTLVGGLRRDLDRIEHRLIGLARGAGASWQEIADSLGLRSRQAAEQRYLRLDASAEPDLGAVRKRVARRREMDARADARAARLRAAAGALIDELEQAVRRTEGVDAVAALALNTLRIAVDSEAGALYDLVTQALDDLRGLPRALSSDALGTAAAGARDALSAIHDGNIEPS
jgi:hypothetical protein